MNRKIYLFLSLLLMMSVLSLYSQNEVTLDNTISGKVVVTARSKITLTSGFKTNTGCSFKAYIDANAIDSPELESYTSSLPSGTTTASTTDSQNFIRSITLRESYSEASLSESDLSNLKHLENIQYFDGLGRPRQTIQVAASPKGYDIIRPIVYDEFGRNARQFLPYVATQKNGAFITSDTTSCKTFYSNGTLAGHLADAKPIALTNFDNSPLNRVTKQYGVGQAWHSANKYVKTEYLTNTSTINSWDEDGGNLPYPAKSLYVIQTTGEDGSITREYKDKQGKDVLKESVNGNETLQTYYIYDDFGLLRTVVPPLAGSPNDTELCYFYTYDGRKRMISKKIPGAEPVYMVYDKRDRLVLSQDGKMRHENANNYLFTKYDALNRPVMTGIITITGLIETIRSNFDNYTDVMFETYSKTSNSPFCYSFDNSYPDGYTISSGNILTATWYDDYSWATGSNFEFSDFASSDTDFPDTKSDKTKGLVTGTIAKNLGNCSSGLTTLTYNTSSIYYDDYGNVTKSISQNHKYEYDVTYTQYEPITHAVLKTTEAHYYNPIDNNPLIITKEFSYDHTGRLLETTYKVNSEDAITLNAMQYNEMGEVITKYLHSATTGNANKTFIQKEDFKYNIRGWLTAINDPTLSTDNDVFGMNLYYNNVDGLESSRVPNGGNYNGNISAMKWGAMGDDTPIRGYGFTYDKLNRLTSGLYGETDNLSSSIGKYSLNFVTYNDNGNIKHLKRFYNWNTSDDLIYNYLNSGKSNQLANINIANSATTDISGVEDYVLRSSSDYDYDDNGNMTFDPGKNTHITYNLLNLPECVTFENGSKIFFHYNAAGNKIAKYIENISSTNETTEYIGNIVYYNDDISFIGTEEGRIIPTEENGSTKWHYEYTMKDHLGNSRVTFTDNLIPGSVEVMQISNYYPFGLVMTQKNFQASSVNYPENKYLYNGKELQNDELGGISLGWYDYGFRMYDAALARWHVIDGHAETYYSWSPYNYVLGNPINLIDWLGLDPVYRNGKYYETDDDGNEYKVDWNYVNNWIQNNDGIAASYSFSTAGGETTITDTEKGNTGLGFTVNGKGYTANSYMTLMGRDDRNNNVGDFSGIDTWSEDEVIRVLGHAAWVIYDLYYGWVESAMFGESLTKPDVPGSGKLDYKISAYDIFGLNRRSLIEINGIVYNANEAGNFLWGMALEYYGGLLSPNTVAQKGTQFASNRDDERWEQKAISAGRAYGRALFQRSDIKENILLNRLDFRGR